MTSILKNFIKAKDALYEKQLIKSKKVQAGKMQYSYYELSDFLPSIVAILRDNNLCHYFSFKNNETCSRGVIKIIDIENQDDYIEIESILCNMTNIKDPKDVGAMSTYLKRYTYLTAFDITEDCKMEQQIGNKNQEDTNIITEINRILRKVGKPERTEKDIKEYTKSTGNNIQWVLDGIIKKYTKR